jgi:hypothetical protein
VHRSVLFLATQSWQQGEEMWPSTGYSVLRCIAFDKVSSVVLQPQVARQEWRSATVFISQTRKWRLQELQRCDQDRAVKWLTSWFLHKPYGWRAVNRTKQRSLQSNRTRRYFQPSRMQSHQQNEGVEKHGDFLSKRGEGNGTCSLERHRVSQSDCVWIETSPRDPGEQLKLEMATWIKTPWTLSKLWMWCD